MSAADIKKCCCSQYQFQAIASQIAVIEGVCLIDLNITIKVQ